ncbi:MAG: PHP domain-containing protein, partial [Butyrivibrio sp.]|nr:PHP domain-containing protein [Butyrivibrio sp.]
MNDAPRPFFEVFPQLQLRSREQEQFADTYVERMSATRKRDYLRIYVRSNSLIDKDTVRRVEAQIQKQFFASDGLTVRICERFRLSAQYTPQILLEEYLDSILREFRDYDPLEYTIVKEAEFTFPADNKLVLRLEDTDVSRSRTQDICRVMDKLLNTRCGMGLEVAVEYVPPKPRKKTETQELAAPARVQEQAPEPATQPAPQKGESTTPDPRQTARARQARGRKGTSSAPARNGRRPHDPDAIYGRDIPDDAVPIADLDELMGVVTVQGRVRNIQTRSFDSGSSLFMFDLYDGTESVVVRLYAEAEMMDRLGTEIKEGSCVKVKGTVDLDKFDHEPNIKRIIGVKHIPDMKTTREDKAETKRVELHCHTNMSEMDAVTEVGTIIKQAYKWGMPGIAITDHGVVQALTEAGHTWDKLYGDACKKAKEEGTPAPDRQSFFKVIPGVEGYLVDDLQEIVTGDVNCSLTDPDQTFVVFDLETTGFSPVRNRIIEIGAVKVRNGEIIDRFSTFVNPEKPIPPRITRITSITDDMVIGAPTRETVLPQFMAFVGDAVLVGHNVSFDVGFIAQNCRDLQLPDRF